MGGRGWRTRRWLAWATTSLGSVALVSVLLAAPLLLPDPPAAPRWVYDGAHLALFTGIGLMWRAFLDHRAVAPGVAIALTIGACIAIGSLGELAQTFVHGRWADMRDVGFDALGGVAGVLLYGRLAPWFAGASE